MYSFVQFMTKLSSGNCNIRALQRDKQNNHIQDHRYQKKLMVKLFGCQKKVRCFVVTFTNIALACLWLLRQGREPLRFQISVQLKYNNNLIT